MQTYAMVRVAGVLDDTRSGRLRERCTNEERRSIRHAEVFIAMRIALTIQNDSRGAASRRVSTLC
jgi:hypothetical protein